MKRKLEKTGIEDYNAYLDNIDTAMEQRQDIRNGLKEWLESASKIVIYSEVSEESMTRVRNLFLENFAALNSNFESQGKKEDERQESYLRKLDAAHKDFHSKQQKLLADAANEERKRLASFRCDFKNMLNRAGVWCTEKVFYWIFGSWAVCLVFTILTIVFLITGTFTIHSV